MLESHSLRHPAVTVLSFTGMRATIRSPQALGLASLALLAACNALTGAGDLTVSPCDGCEESESGIRVDGAVVEDGQGPGPGSDGSTDGPAGDTAKEGLGGTLDPTFGTGGFVVIDPLVDPHAVAVRSDGRIVVVGATSNALAAAAFTPSGAVDLTFGTAGRVIKGQGTSSIGSAVAFDSQGRTVVGGTSIVVLTTAVHYTYVVRIGASQLDATFSNNGAYRGNSGEDGRGVVVTANDAIVVASSGGNDYRFQRLTVDGGPDLTFGNMGFASFANVGGEPTCLIAQVDGFVSAGTGNGPTGQSLTATKLSLLGQPVNAFGSLGKAVSKVGPNNNETGQSVAAQADGKILIGGDYDPNVGNIRRVSVATRLTSSGQVDATYATAGKFVLDLSDPLIGKETDTTNTNLVLDSSGRALVVGNVHDRLNGGGDRFRGWVARLRVDGTLDPLFGTQGKLVIGTAPAQFVVRGAALQPDGKLVVVGVDNNANKLFLARIITSTTM